MHHAAKVCSITFEPLKMERKCKEMLVFPIKLSTGPISENIVCMLHPADSLRSVMNINCTNQVSFLLIKRAHSENCDEIIVHTTFHTINLSDTIVCKVVGHF